MGSTIKDHNRLALVDYVDSYFKLKPPDCRLFSQDGCQISIHKVKSKGPGAKNDTSENPGSFNQILTFES